jgi:hypothetical protein
MDGSSRKYGDLALMPGQSGEFTTGNLAVYIGPMFDIGKRMNLSSGLVQNYLFNPELKTTTGNKDVSSEVTNPNCRGKAYVKQMVEWAKLYAIQNNKKFIRLDTVGENQKLIQHYTSFGVNFLGLSQLTNTADLPMHYHNATVSLFELSV